MEEILHQLIGSLSQYLQVYISGGLPGFFHQQYYVYYTSSIDLFAIEWLNHQVVVFHLGKP